MDDTVVGPQLGLTEYFRQKGKHEKIPRIFLGKTKGKKNKGKYYKQGYYYVILLCGVLRCCSREFNSMPSLYLALKRDFQAFEESPLKMM